MKGKIEFWKIGPSHFWIKHGYVIIAEWMTACRGENEFWNLYKDFSILNLLNQTPSALFEKGYT